MSRLRLRWTGPHPHGGPRSWTTTLNAPAWLELFEYGEGLWSWELGGVGETISDFTMFDTRLAATRDALRYYRAHPQSDGDYRERKVRCWVCGYTGWAMPRGVGRPVRTRQWVTSYGRCPARAHGSSCRGTLHEPADASLILRCALAHDRAGGNRRSEYDL